MTLYLMDHGRVWLVFQKKLRIVKFKDGNSELAYFINVYFIYSWHKPGVSVFSVLPEVFLYFGTFLFSLSFLLEFLGYRWGHVCDMFN